MEQTAALSREWKGFSVQQVYLLKSKHLLSVCFTILLEIATGVPTELLFAPSAGSLHL